MSKVNYDLVTSIIFIIIAIIALWETKGLSKMSYIFPRTVAAVLLALSIIYFIKGLMQRKEEKVFEVVKRSKVVIIILSIVIYVAFIGIIGFFLASLIFMAVLSSYLQKDEHKSKRRKLLQSMVSSVLVTVSFYGLFKFIFNVPLPVGWLFSS